MLVPVILSGGAGTRLWPVSRESHPKPFLRLPDGQTLIQKAFGRAAAIEGVCEVLTVTNREHYFSTEDNYSELAQFASIRKSYLLETEGRNTAAAIAAAALFVQDRYGSDAVLLVLAADHLITEPQAFGLAISEAVEAAQAGFLVTFGIKPSAPETGYGYVEMGDSAAGGAARRVRRFIEKPTLAVAQHLLESGHNLWNSGMFCFKASLLLEEMARWAPEVHQAMGECMQASRRGEGPHGVTIELDASAMQRSPLISIDYAVMEKSDKVAVVACDIGWSDVGSWNALCDVAEPDRDGNRVLGQAVLHDVSNCYVQSADRMVGAVGVHDLVIVDTPDALLVADKSRAQDVKYLVANLKQSGHEAYRVHRTVHRPWGTYTVLEEGERFKIKRIEVKPGASLSLQMHHHRSEHWIVVSGMARVVNGEQEMFVSVNESTYIPAGYRHRLENPGRLPLVLIEVQCGDYLGEDDIVRFDDIYGRK